MIAAKIGTDLAPHHARRLPLEEIFSFFKDITSGLAHLHANNYVHRDLKPQNCLLHRNGNSLRVLVSDFGEMQGVSVPRSSNATGYTGTMSFTAPEILTRNSQGALGNFTFKSDVFSLGMVMFFMCFGRLPYHYANLDDDAREDLDGLRDEVLAWQGMKTGRKERSDLPDMLYENLKLLLSRDPDQRPSTDDILRRMGAGSTFHDPRATSPLQDRFPSPEFGFKTDHSRSPDGEANGSWTNTAPNTAPKLPRRVSSETQKAPTLRHRPAKRESKELVVSKSLPSAALPSPRIAHANEKRHSHPPLLMPPPSTSLYQKMIMVIHRQETVVFVKCLVFLSKVWTMMSACSPSTPNQKILYPLLGIAALDLTGYIQGAWPSTILAIIHALVIFVADRTYAMCQR